MRESEIEKRVCDYGIARGLLAWKQTGRKGLPDRLFLDPGTGNVAFVEFKQKGHKPTPLQKRTIEKLQPSFKIAVIDNVDDGIYLLDQWISEWKDTRVIDWWAVLPRSDKFFGGINDSETYVSACFHTRVQAAKYSRQNWPETGEVHKIAVSFPVPSNPTYFGSSKRSSVDPGGPGEDNSNLISFESFVRNKKDS